MAADIGSLFNAGQKIVEGATFEEDLSFEDLGGPSVGAKIAAMAPENRALLKKRMRERLPADAAGRITYGARANAVKGRLPV